jgi:hypothetical protein
MAPRKKVLNEEPKVLPENEVMQEKPVEIVEKSKPVLKTKAKKVIKTENTEQQAASAPVKIEAPSMDPELSPSQSNRGALILGAGLLLMGIVLLLGRILSIPLGDYMWPFIFIIPGVLVFLSALASDSSSGEGLSILGAILTSLGLIFLAQQITGLWASWAYVWALVAPTSIGVAQMVYGTRKDRDKIVQSGRKLINLGLLMFAIGFVFFELIIGINGFGIGNFGLPVLPVMMIFVGVVILARALIKNR